MFLKRKRTGKVKARGCADGRPQRGCITKEESSSPTASMHALMASCVMDSIEEQSVITCDMPGAFLQGDWPQEKGKECCLKFKNIMVDMICEIEPSYKKHIICPKSGKKLLYAKLNKAFYGTLLGAIIFYEKLAKQLNEWGFQMNPCNECAFNKTANGNQLTAQFHVDDLKASHKDQRVLDNLMCELKAVFGKEDESSETKGKAHEYLGVTINHFAPRKVAITMFEYLEDIIVEAEEKLGALLNKDNQYPCNGKIFQINDNSPRLNKETAEFAHRMIARLLFTAKRARPDILLATAFLCARVKDLAEEDLKKLTRLLSRIKQTIHLPLILGANDEEALTWNIDASCAVHPDMRSHARAAFTLGNGSIISISSKQKINTKSSTEAELVGVDDAMLLVLWAKCFFEAQAECAAENSKLRKLGKTNIIEQDNASAMLLEKNGKRSSTKRTKHINMRYFFITDRINSGDVTDVVCKSTTEMESDYLTKGLQGSAFFKHRQVIMGLEGVDEYALHRSHKEEQMKR